jgi:hypothetical protein
MDKKYNIGLRSREVREILDTPPTWIIRWGTLIITLFLLALFLIVWIFYK